MAFLPRGVEAMWQQFPPDTRQTRQSHPGDIDSL
jgi:hypothetical protein